MTGLENRGILGQSEARGKKAERKKVDRKEETTCECWSPIHRVHANLTNRLPEGCQDPGETSARKKKAKQKMRSSTNEPPSACRLADTFLQIHPPMSNLTTHLTVDWICPPMTNQIRRPMRGRHQQTSRSLFHFPTLFSDLLSTYFLSIAFSTYSYLQLFC